MRSYDDIYNPDYYVPDNRPKRPEKALDLERVKCALILCVVGVAALFLPYMTFPDEALVYYRNIEHNTYNLFAMYEIEEPYMYIAIALLVGFVLTAVFFLTDHPKLTLIPLFAVMLPAMTLLLGVLSSIAWDTNGKMTVCPPIQMCCTLILIILAFATKKVKIKPNKQQYGSY